MFLDKNFLLSNDISRHLYHDVAKDLPIIDFHNHVDPLKIAGNRNFENLTEAWISSDPYKHRAMRICGIPENGITGNASDRDKYMNWVKIFPLTIGNPLFHWTCMELNYIFGVDNILSQKNAMEIWDKCNFILHKDGYGARDIVKKFNAEIICTSDDITDDLSSHKKINIEENGFKMLPSLRADTILNFENENYVAWLTKLSAQCDNPVETLEDYKIAILKRLDYFSEAGCRIADHSLDAGFIFNLIPEDEAARNFQVLRSGSILSQSQLVGLKSAVMIFLGQEYNRRKWTMELHIGAFRITSSRLRKLVGVHGGYAGIGNSTDIRSLCSFLDELDKNDKLPRTVLFNLNPSDNALFAALTGSYASDGVKGKIQFGPAWWYNDHLDGIRKQLSDLSNYSMLGCFIGMTTDSRSVLSFSRHEYFRRILCDMLGKWVQEGNIPDDMDLLSRIVTDISYHNSKEMLFT